MTTEIARNLQRVQGRIASAAARAGRQPSDVTCVAVTKTRSVPEIEAAYRAGVREIGENRVGEAEEKRSALHLPNLRWHMVGHLQSRKSKRAIDLFDIIHSVDSLKLARKLDRLARQRDRVLPILIEINVSQEESKYGFSLRQRDALYGVIGEIVGMPHLSVEGLMTVAFVARDPKETRPLFAQLRELRDAFRDRYPSAPWTHLSMGMTDDFEIAVEEGSTMVRIGRAIFGPRD